MACKTQGKQTNKFIGQWISLGNVPKQDVPNAHAQKCSRMIRMTDSEAS